MSFNSARYHCQASDSSVSKSKAIILKVDWRFFPLVAISDWFALFLVSLQPVPWEGLATSKGTRKLLSGSFSSSSFRFLCVQSLNIEQLGFLLRVVDVVVSDGPRGHLVGLSYVQPHQAHWEVEGAADDTLVSVQLRLMFGLDVVFQVVFTRAHLSTLGTNTFFRHVDASHHCHVCVNFFLWEELLFRTVGAPEGLKVFEHVSSQRFHSREPFWTVLADVTFL